MNSKANCALENLGEHLNPRTALKSPLLLLSRVFNRLFRKRG
jgi:hypothetical protein